MKLYFVRHGESEQNKLEVHQTGHTPLSKTGQKQAKALANRFKTIPIESILASDYIRAKQTAEKIAETTDTQITFTPLLRERKRPTELHGVPYIGKESSAVYKLLRDNHSDPSYHYSDEENFFDVVQRAKEFINFVESMKEKNIAVVSHAAFIKFILGVMMHGKDLTPSIYDAFYMFFISNNTGITVCERHEDKFGEDHGQTQKRWHIITWNDHSHLG